MAGCPCSSEQFDGTGASAPRGPELGHFGFSRNPTAWTRPGVREALGQYLLEGAKQEMRWLQSCCFSKYKTEAPLHGGHWGVLKVRPGGEAPPQPGEQEDFLRDVHMRGTGVGGVGGCR